jgi:hypothetical protein
MVVFCFLIFGVAVALEVHALKGHGFSRAARSPQELYGL